MTLPRNFRKLTLNNRRSQIQSGFYLSDSLDGIDNPEQLLKTADTMIENAAGIMAIPLGFVPELLINGKSYTIPMATEEPSVIAAASFAATIVNKEGGVKASGAEALMTEQIFLSISSQASIQHMKDLESEIFKGAHSVLASMEKRGGGLQKMEVIPLNDTIVKVELLVNVCDAMGANILNTLGEEIGSWLAEKTATKLLMAIVSNSGESRISSAGFSLPAAVLSRGGKSGSEIAEKIVLASQIAELDSKRAVTHNKGIMNGITALILATGNDSRAVESAAHLHAGVGGKYSSLSHFQLRDGILTASIEVPIPAAIVGGAVNFHQTARNNLKILGVSSASELSAVAASLGLIQNFAALFALVSEGIQKGHMRLHTKKSETL